MTTTWHARMHLAKFPKFARFYQVNQITKWGRGITMSKILVGSSGAWMRDRPKTDFSALGTIAFTIENTDKDRDGKIRRLLDMWPGSTEVDRLCILAALNAPPIGG